MKEIIFRGKRVDNGEWVEGIPIKTHIGTFIVYEENPHYCSQYGYMEIDGLVKVAQETIGQYTGLKDNNGKKIFEGDISREGLVVRWSDNKASFVLTKNGWMYNHFFGEAIAVADGVADINIVGNIHDNPEMLKGGEQE